MKNIFQVRVGRRGTITIPRELRNRNTIEEGDLLKLTNVGNGVVVMSRLHSHVNKAANQLTKEWKQAGVSLPSMLEALRKVRKESSHETL
jgi:AbrB family looped-hinge helix DNA binding protein